MQSVGWKWDQVQETRWEDPAEEAYWLAARWKTLGPRFLDLGTGIGRHALYFARQGYEVSAFDIAESGLQRLQESARTEGLSIQAQQGDFLSLPYPDASFDSLMAFHVIYHSDRQGTEQALAEINRVLRPGGEAYVTFNSRRNPTLRDKTHHVVDRYLVIPTEGIEEGIPHYYVDLPEVRRLTKGFKLLRLRHIGNLKSDGSMSWHYFVLLQKNN